MTASPAANCPGPPPSPAGFGSHRKIDGAASSLDAAMRSTLPSSSSVQVAPVVSGNSPRGVRLDAESYHTSARLVSTKWMRGGMGALAKSSGLTAPVPTSAPIASAFCRLLRAAKNPPSRPRRVTPDAPAPLLPTLPAAVGAGRCAKAMAVELSMQRYASPSLSVRTLRGSAFSACATLTSNSPDSTWSRSMCTKPTSLKLNRTTSEPPSAPSTYSPVIGRGDAPGRADAKAARTARALTTSSSGRRGGPESGSPMAEEEPEAPPVPGEAAVLTAARPVAAVVRVTSRRSSSCRESASTAWVGSPAISARTKSSNEAGRGASSVAHVRSTSRL